MNPTSVSAVNMEALLRQAREASFQTATLDEAAKNNALEQFARLIEENTESLLSANQKDLAAAEANEISATMFQRLKLDAAKLQQLVSGIRDVVRLTDPVGAIASRVQLDDGLVLERVSVPLGVIGIIFESRPDVIPQILSLILKSGNAVVLKGGKEAYHTNHAFMTLVEKLNNVCPVLPAAWAQLIDSREAVREMLAYPQYVDLVIPRGSNQLVQSVMAATQIPVLGHADGVCHLYVHPSASIEKAIPLIVDAKIQYPAACNALETLLVDSEVAGRFFPAFQHAAAAANLQLIGCEQTRTFIPEAQPASDDDWHTEYGDLRLSVKVVSGMDAAIAHINSYGSHHTDGILAADPAAIEIFLNAVDSASVFANASTRFADGFRYGLGAEIGISTAKTHARGPVGLEGLVIYKYKLRGTGQIVADYVGPDAKSFQHKTLPLRPE